jgi:hypothetical protein
MIEIPIEIREANIKIAEYLADKKHSDRESAEWAQAFSRELHGLTINLILEPRPNA